MKILHSFILNPTKVTSRQSLFSLIPFNTSIVQTRWKKKPADTALTRLHSRVRDPKLDLLTTHFIRLTCILDLHNLISSRKRGPFVSVQLLTKWMPHVGLTTIPAGTVIRKYPHIFEIFTHPIAQNRCCKFTSEFVSLLKEENNVTCEAESVNVMRIRRILMMSVNGRIHLHALRLSRRELGLPENFRESIIRKYDNIFMLVDLEIVELVERNNKIINEDARFMGTAKVESWREREYREKWLCEFEVKFAFPMNFPTGFKKEPGFKERLRNWQRLSYVKPYEQMEVVRVRTCGGVERYEKRAVGIIHELLCFTVEKMLEVEHLAHFRKDLGIEVNVRELLLMHPGIFYLSNKGNTQIVFLRQAYSQGFLVEPSPIYDVRRKMMDLIAFGSRRPRKVRTESEFTEKGHNLSCIESRTQTNDGSFVVPILDRFVNCNHDDEPGQIIDLPKEDMIRTS